MTLFYYYYYYYYLLSNYRCNYKKWKCRVWEVKSGGAKAKVSPIHITSHGATMWIFKHIHENTGFSIPLFSTPARYFIYSLSTVCFLLSEKESLIRVHSSKLFTSHHWAVSSSLSLSFFLSLFPIFLLLLYSPP